MINKKYLIPGLLAGLIYNIWPLGFILDPGVINNSYISTLEATTEPHHVLFIFFDVVCSLIIIAVCVTLLVRKDLSKGLMLGYFLIGITILIAAVIPETCTASIAKCGIGANEIIDPHDFMSIIGAFSIFFCLKSILKNSSKKLRNLYKYTFLTWCSSGLLLVVSTVTSRFTLFSQAFFLLMCGVAMVAIPISGKTKLKGKP